MELRPTFTRGASVNGLTHIKARLGQRRYAAPERTEIEHRAADEQGQTTAFMNGGDECYGVLHEATCGVAVGRLADVDEVMRYTRAQLARWLRGPDIEAAVDERGVDADDFERQLFGEVDRPVCFAGACRPGQHEHGLASHSRTLRQRPR